MYCIEDIFKNASDTIHQAGSQECMLTISCTAKCCHKGNKRHYLSYFDNFPVCQDRSLMRSEANPMKLASPMRLDLQAEDARLILMIKNYV